jgi:putative oxidoreductase
MPFTLLSGQTTLALTALRIAAGLAYFSHGAQKLFGWFGGIDGQGASAELMSRFGAAAVIETTAGLCIALGLFTRLVAFIASGEMAVGYFWMHAMTSGSIWWWVNRGEVLMLFSFIFLYFAARGPGPISIDAKLEAGRPAP